MNETFSESRTAVIFRSEGGLYAFGIEILSEILSDREVTPVPCLPGYVPGVINLRGEVIPVIDLRRRLGFEDAEPTGREALLVIECDGVTAAVRADTVVTSVTYENESYMPFEEESIAAGIILDGEEQITLIDPKKLLKSEK